MTGLVDEILDLSRQRLAGPLSPWFADRLRAQVEAGAFLPGATLEATGRALVRQLQDYREQAGVATAVLGISGGVDSALTAALLLRAGWRVIGMTLPIEQDPIETERGIEVCTAFGIEHRHHDLTEQYRAMLAGLEALDRDMIASDETRHRVRRGNVRARLRMLTLYDQAHCAGGLVASTDNFSELSAGFWTLHGDVGDLAPIQSLLKSWEVPWLARHLGVPERTWRATPTDGLGIGAGDEAQIGATYLEWDIVQFALVEALRDDPGLSTQHLVFILGMHEDRHAQEVLGTVLARMRTTWHKRMNPIRLNHPQADRMGPLAALETRLFRPAVLRSDEAMLEFPPDLQDLAAHLVRALKTSERRVVTAESCTGGLIAACISGVPGCGDALQGSFVAWRPSMKMGCLGVPEALIADKTVYHPEVAARMAEGALAGVPEASLAISVTGVAGPDEDEGHPPGYVCIGTACKGGRAEATEHRFEGPPRRVLAQIIEAALKAGLAALQGGDRPCVGEHPPKTPVA